MLGIWFCFSSLTVLLPALPPAYLLNTLFSILLSSIMWPKNLIWQHRTAWFSHEQHHLAVIVQKKWRTAYETSMNVGKTKSSITSKSWKCEGPPYTMHVVHVWRNRCLQPVGLRVREGRAESLPQGLSYALTAEFIPQSQNVELCWINLSVCSTRSQEFLCALCSLGH